MNRSVRNKKKKILTIVCMFSILICLWAFAPLWVNPCIPTHLNEDEIEQTREFPNYRNLSLEQQTEVDQLYQKAEIPCGAKDLPLPEKLRAANWEGRILNELEFGSLLILRFELVKIDDYGGGYYFKGYTLFYIPIYRVFAGGSGYMEIDMVPFEDNELFIADWE